MQIQLIRKLSLGLRQTVRMIMWWIKTRSLLTFPLLTSSSLENNSQITLRHIWCIHEIRLIKYSQQEDRFWATDFVLKLTDCKHTMWTRRRLVQTKRTKFINSIYCFYFRLKLQFVVQTELKTLHGHRTNEKKIENFFLAALFVSIINVHEF